MVGIENLTLLLCRTSIGENCAIYHIGTAAADGMLYKFFVGFFFFFSILDRLVIFITFDVE